MSVRQIMALLADRGWMMTTAESCTGGMIAAAITDFAGSSTVFDRGFVTYSNAAKIEMLGIRPDTLAAHGAVSEEIAREMAQGAVRHSAAEVAVSVTGIAGPGGSEHKPEGRVCFAVTTPAGTVSETEEFGPLGRNLVRQASVAHALHLVLIALQKS